jgi:hypothetical protein
MAKKSKKIRLIISGSRSLKTFGLIEKAIAYANIDIKNIKEVVHGNAIGIDKLAGLWAKYHDIPVKIFPAEWNNLDVPNVVIGKNDLGTYNKLAGINRNEKMAEYGDVLLAIWDGQSRGTEHLIEFVKKLGKDFVVYEI